VGFYGANVRAAGEQTHYQRDEGDMDLTRDALINEINGLADSYKQIAQDVKGAETDEEREAREKRIEAAIQPLQLDLYTLLLQAHALSLDTAVDKGGAPVEAFLRDKLLIEGLGATAADLTKFGKQADLGYGGLMLGYAIAKAAKVAPAEVFTNKTDNALSWLGVMHKRNLTVTDIIGVLDELDL